MITITLGGAMRRHVTELVGTFLLVFVVAMVVLAESTMAPLAIGGAAPSCTPATTSPAGTTTRR